MPLICFVFTVHRSRSWFSVSRYQDIEDFLIYIVFVLEWMSASEPTKGSLCVCVCVCLINVEVGDCYHWSRYLTFGVG